MMNENIINIRIYIEQRKITFEISESAFPTVIAIGKDKIPITKDESTDECNIRVEHSIAKVFHKVLNLLKVNKDLFQKEDFDLLGEMLSKILFGKNKTDHRNSVMEGIERQLDLSKDKVCRIFLEFEANSDMAMLPWEYTLYETRRKKNSDPYYFISAFKESRFYLMRRMNNNETPNPEVSRLFIIVIISADGNGEATPPISERWEEVSKVKKMFEGLTKNKNYEQKLTVKFIESPTAVEVKEEVEQLYHEWEQQNEEPHYVLHYLGHSILENEVGKLVIKNQYGKADWIEDSKFAAVFNSKKLKVKQPSVVCFQSCDSAKIGSIANTLRGVAYEFTQLDIPAVVGMQNEISTEVSNAFYEKFYESLLDGKDVAEAITIGRDYLGREYKTDKDDHDETIYKNNWFGSPVLFITTKEPVQLLKAKEPAPAAEVQQHTAQQSGVSISSPLNRLTSATATVATGQETQIEVAQSDRNLLSDSARVPDETVVSKPLSGEAERINETPSGQINQPSQPRHNDH